MASKSFLRSALSVTCKVQRSSSSGIASSSSRQLHTCPPTPDVLKNGCAPFLSSNTVQQISQEWQGGLLNQLNQQVRDTEFASSSVVDTVIRLSQDRSNILAFNYASLALNNSFFLSSLLPGDQNKDNVPLPRTSTSISKSFGSFPEMCLAFSSAALGMSGSGWVWLVTDQHKNLGIVPTFGAGTVIVQSRIQQGKNFLLPSINDQSSSSSTFAEKEQRPLDSMFVGIGKKKVGKQLYPLLNISVHEHAWLNDYGIMGKEAYLTRFWNCVNWEIVEKRLDEYTPPPTQYF